MAEAETEKKILSYTADEIDDLLDYVADLKTSEDTGTSTTSNINFTYEEATYYNIEEDDCTAEYEDPFCDLEEDSVIATTESITFDIYDWDDTNVISIFTACVNAKLEQAQED